MRSEEVSTRIAEKMFENRRGHGSSAKIVERHLRFGDVKELAKMAYELGFQDGRAVEAMNQKKEGKA